VAERFDVPVMVLGYEAVYRHLAGTSASAGAVLASDALA
jgi:hypothetical protein